MIRAALRLPPWRRRSSQEPITPASSATSTPAGTHIAVSRSDERCEGVSWSELSCADVDASERNRCPLAELDDRLAGTPRLASAATARCTADADVDTLSREVGRADVARRSPARVRPLPSCCDRDVRARASRCSSEPVRTSSTFAALGTEGSALEATAPVLSFAAVSCVPALASPEPVSPALAEGSCADGAGGSAALGDAVGTARAAGTAADAGADAAATEASGRAAGGVRDGSKGKGST